MSEMRGVQQQRPDGSWGPAVPVDPVALAREQRGIRWSLRRRRLKAWAGYLRAVLAEKSYIVRPYDPVADARRWFWQRRKPCGRQQAEQLPQWVREGLVRAVTEHMRKRP